MADFNLIIVESPTKAKTIARFVGKDYQVEASYGHIRDLPKNKLGVDLENNFKPNYIIPLKARKIVSKLKKKSKETKKVILATDEDREGEAIAWHLIQALELEKFKKKDEIQRIVFHEITKKAIEEALKNPREINYHLVQAQQARRILDRLVGYLLSPFLWKKVAQRLSAGRVQSVALRLIVEREKEIRNFKSEEYWTINALFEKIDHQKSKKEKSFEAELIKINDQPLSKLAIKNEKEAQEIAKELKKANFQISKIEKRIVKKNPPPPFITSTLQQEAFKKLGFSSKQTMLLAQELYEKGFITYMRTDSYHLSQESLTACRTWIEKNLGAPYLMEKPRVFKTKSRLAQEAHEAIRPTQVDLEPKLLKGESKKAQKLYELIWQRFIACQLPPALFEATTIEIDGQFEKNHYQLKTTGNILRFDGFLKIWKSKFSEKILPDLQENEKLKLIEVKPNQHFTEPPPRYNEATLVKTLESYGIGRPSTYAPIISVIQERNYVKKDENKRFYPTEIGELVNEILVNNFPDIFNVDFTAKMEENLDLIAENKKTWQEVLKEFYEPFSKTLAQKYLEVSKKDLIKEETEEKCEKCGRSMVVKISRFGRFLACSGFPECQNTKNLNNQNQIKNSEGQEIKCPKCAQGLIFQKRTKKGKIFYGCSRYPECDFATWKLKNINGT